MSGGLLDAFHDLLAMGLEDWASVHVCETLEREHLLSLWAELEDVLESQ